MSNTKKTVFLVFSTMVLSVIYFYSADNKTENFPEITSAPSEQRPLETADNRPNTKQVNSKSPSNKNEVINRKNLAPIKRVEELEKNINKFIAAQKTNEFSYKARNESMKALREFDRLFTFATETQKVEIAQKLGKLALSEVKSEHSDEALMKIVEANQVELFQILYRVDQELADQILARNPLRSFRYAKKLIQTDKNTF